MVHDRGYNERLDTFKTWPHQHPSAKEVAAAGYILKAVTDYPYNVQCISCKAETYHWDPLDAPLVKHLHDSPACELANHLLDKCGVIIGYWRYSSVLAVEEKHRVRAFIDDHGRLQMHVQPTNRDNTKDLSAYPPPSTIEPREIVVDPHLVNLDCDVIKQYVDIQAGGWTQGEKAAVVEAIRCIDENPALETDCPSVVYGLVIPLHIIEAHPEWQQHLVRARDTPARVVRRRPESRAVGIRQVTTSSSSPSRPLAFELPEITAVYPTSHSAERPVLSPQASNDEISAVSRDSHIELSLGCEKSFTQESALRRPLQITTIRFKLEAHLKFLHAILIQTKKVVYCETVIHDLE